MDWRKEITRWLQPVLLTTSGMEGNTYEVYRLLQERGVYDLLVYNPGPRWVCSEVNLCGVP